MAPLIWYSFHRLPLWAVHVMALLCDVLVVVACFAVGVRWSPMAAALAWVVLGTTIFLIGQVRIAIAHLVPIGISYGIVVALQEGNTAPTARWLGIMGIVVLTGSTVSGLMERTRHLATEAREARGVAEEAQAELADLNRTLEARVIDQVDELARLNGLRRFLAAPVADALLTEGVPSCSSRTVARSPCSSATCVGSPASPAAPSRRTSSTCSTTTTARSASPEALRGDGRHLRRRRGDGVPR